VTVRTAILILAIALLGGCQYDPWAGRFLTMQPSPKDLSGTYLIDSDSQKRAIKFGLHNAIFPVDHSARIVLSPDHEAEFIHVPELFQGEVPCSVTGRGSWQLEKFDSYFVVWARINDNEEASSCKGDTAYEVMLYGRKPPYKLHITIGDPDSGDAVQFEKQQ
jgi:hypothetical protein